MKLESQYREWYLAKFKRCWKAENQPVLPPNEYHWGVETCEYDTEAYFADFLAM